MITLEMLAGYEDGYVSMEKIAGLSNIVSETLPGARKFDELMRRRLPKIETASMRYERLAKERLNKLKQKWENEIRAVKEQALKERPIAERAFSRAQAIQNNKRLSSARKQELLSRVPRASAAEAMHRERVGNRMRKQLYRLSRAAEHTVDARKYKKLFDSGKENTNAGNIIYNRIKQKSYIGKRVRELVPKKYEDFAYRM